MAVLIEVTDKGAIYIDATRITDRSTKWGVHHTIFEVEAPAQKVVAILLANGFSKQVGRIDTEPYMTQARAALAQSEGK